MSGCQAARQLSFVISGGDSIGGKAQGAGVSVRLINNTNVTCVCLCVQRKTDIS